LLWIGLEVQMEKQYFERLCFADCSRLVIPERLSHLLAWLLGEKLLRMNPNAGDRELAEVLESENLEATSLRILAETAGIKRWHIKDEDFYEIFAMARFASSVRGIAPSHHGIPAYNDLRKRMGLPALHQWPELEVKTDEAVQSSESAQPADGKPSSGTTLGNENP
jgi:hypothetical protein